jgi:hypothetical protein
MDTFDDFEMRPLTSGLGFDSKPKNLKDSVSKSRLVRDEVSRSLPTAPPPEEMEAADTRSSAEVLAELKEALKPIEKKESISLTSTLPRAGEIEIPRSNPQVDIPTERKDPLADISFEVPDVDMTENNTVSPGVRRGASDALIRPLVPVSFNIGAAFLDGAIVLALSLIFLVALVSVTGIDVVAVLASAQVDLAAQLSLAVLYLAVLEMFLILSRSFFGKTLGEWTFDMQLGEDEQFDRASYPFKVLFRSIINLVTGFVLLPFVSLIIGKDIAGKISGVRLFRQNT